MECTGAGKLGVGANLSYCPDCGGQSPQVPMKAQFHQGRLRYLIHDHESAEGEAYAALQAHLAQPHCPGSGKVPTPQANGRLACPECGARRVVGKRDIVPEHQPVRWSTDRLAQIEQRRQQERLALEGILEQYRRVTPGRTWVITQPGDDTQSDAWTYVLTLDGVSVGSRSGRAKTAHWMSGMLAMVERLGAP